jgi:hypothetical protein
LTPSVFLSNFLRKNTGKAEINMGIRYFYFKIPNHSVYLIFEKPQKSQKNETDEDLET